MDKKQCGSDSSLSERKLHHRAVHCSLLVQWKNKEQENLSALLQNSHDNTDVFVQAAKLNNLPAGVEIIDFLFLLAVSPLERN